MDNNCNIIYNRIQPYTLLCLDRFEWIYRFLKVTSRLDGDIAELGVYRGGTAAGMALIAPHKCLHLFDTFDGMRSSQYESGHSEGDFADTSEELVRSLFSESFALKIHKGWFPETITENLKNTKFCFVHIDGDYYESTRDAIDFFYPRMVTNGILAFDDWERGSCPGVKKAILEGKEKYNYEIKTVRLQAFIRKS